MSGTSTNAAFTGSIPEHYDTYLGPILFEFSGADMARQVTAALNRPARVLEVACGTGISTRHLAHALAPGSELVATDLNTAMLDHAARVNGDLPGVTYSQADGRLRPAGARLYYRQPDHSRGGAAGYCRRRGPDRRRNHSA